MSDRGRELQDKVNTLTIRAYRSEDRLDALCDAVRDWADAYRSGLLRGSHVTEERLLAASEVCTQAKEGE